MAVPILRPKPNVPPIPNRLLGCETIAGRVVPWIQVRLADGGVDFRARHHRKIIACWQQGLCQVDGQPLDPARFVLLGGPDQVGELLFDEPPMHPECARYTALACEMVAGRRPRFASGPSVSETHRGRKCVDPGCECDGWVSSGDATQRGKPAHAWYAVWARGYAIAVAPDNQTLHGGALSRDDVRAVSVVTPGAAHSRSWTGPWRRLSNDEVDALIVDPVHDREDADPV